MELLISSQEFDQLLQEHLDTSTIFRGTSVFIQNCLMKSVADVIKHKIFNEIQNTQLCLTKQLILVIIYYYKIVIYY